MGYTEQDPRFTADLAFLGNRLPDREARVERFFLEPAGALADRKFLIGGNGWETKSMPQNVTTRCGKMKKPSMPRQRKVNG